MSNDKDDYKEIWDTDYMIEHAKSLQRVAEELRKNIGLDEKDQFLFRGAFLAEPILMSLATEIALKAWSCREQNRKPAKTHNLEELFSGLNPSTQEMLEAKMRKVSPNSVWAEDLRARNLSSDMQDILMAKMHPLRDILCSHRVANMHWRFLYEKTSARFETAEIDRALTVIIAAYDEKWAVRHRF